MNLSRITEFFVDRWQLTVVLFAMLAAMGMSAWSGIPRAEDPSIPLAAYRVVAVYPGATPTDVEQLVVDPIEERVGELDELREVSASVTDGLAVVFVQFQPSSDPDDRAARSMSPVDSWRIPRRSTSRAACRFPTRLRARRDRACALSCRAWWRCRARPGADACAGREVRPRSDRRGAVA